MLTLERLAHLAASHPAALQSRVEGFHLHGKSFDFCTKPAIMGVINLSPDSWYRESVCLNTTRAAERARVLSAQGADIIDIGAESTLAHAARVGEQTQGDLLTPLVRQLKSENILVSVETYSPEVTRRTLEAGAAVINLTGTVGTDEIFRAAAEHEAAVIMCYVQGANVREVSDYDLARDPIGACYEYFARAVDQARRVGVKRIFVDPGLGFYYRNLGDSATRVKHQMHVFLNSFRLRPLGCPICHALPHAFEFFGDEVRTAEAFFAVLASLGSTNLFRTHEVPKVRAVLETLQQA